jgi:hypothetical protein
VSKKFDLNDFMDELPDIPAVKKKSGSFDDPLGGLDATSVTRVTGQNTDAKGRVRKTIFLPPDLIWRIEEAAKREGYTRLMDFYHWLMAEGWAQWEGGKRPEAESVTTTREIKV